MTRESIDEKGARYLAEGRVSIFEARRDPAGHLMDATLLVRGSGEEPYRVTCDGWGWLCTCPAYVTRCAHIAAAQQITDWEPRMERPRLRVPSDLDWAFAG